LPFGLIGACSLVCNVSEFCPSAGAAPQVLPTIRQIEQRANSWIALIALLELWASRREIPLGSERSTFLEKLPRRGSVDLRRSGSWRYRDRPNQC
jgi:hypothetical protein